MSEATPKWLEHATHRKIAVHTVTDHTFEGILRLATEDGLLLWNAGVRMDANNLVTLEGEVFVPRTQVLFVHTLRM